MGCNGGGGSVGGDGRIESRKGGGAGVDTECGTVGGDGSATRGFRPYDQLTIAPVTDVPNFNYQAKILVPYFASGTNFTDYREIQMTGECKWCQESYESYDIPCYTPRTTKNPYQFCVMENPTPNSEKKVCTRPLW